MTVHWACLLCLGSLGCACACVRTYVCGVCVVCVWCVRMYVCVVCALYACACVCVRTRLFHSDLQSVLDLTREVKDIEDPNAYRCVIHHSTPPELHAPPLTATPLPSDMFPCLVLLLDPPQH